MTAETALAPETGAGNPKPPVSDPQGDVILSSAQLLARLPFKSAKLRRLEQMGVIPVIRPDGVRAKAYIWNDVVAALRRHQRGGEV